MTKGARAIEPGATIQQAAVLMRQHAIGMLAVMTRGQMRGVITDRDIAVRGVAEGRTPGATSVEEVMTPAVTTCFEDQLVIDAALLMQGNQVRRLVVLDRDNNPVGVLSLSDLATEAHDEQLTETTLEAVAEK
jgi:CBS domain-containing protein